jgi:hypothetical protein
VAGGDETAVLDALTALQPDRKLGEVLVGSVAVEHGAVDEPRLWGAVAVAVPGEIRGLGLPFLHQQPCSLKIEVGTFVTNARLQTVSRAGAPSRANAASDRSIISRESPLTMKTMREL